MVKKHSRNGMVQSYSQAQFYASPKSPRRTGMINSSSPVNGTPISIPIKTIDVY